MFLEVFAIAMLAIVISAVLFVSAWFYMESRAKKNELMKHLSEWLKRQEEK